MIINRDILLLEKHLQEVLEQKSAYEQLFLLETNKTEQLNTRIEGLRKENIELGTKIHGYVTENGRLHSLSNDQNETIKKLASRISELIDQVDAQALVIESKNKDIDNLYRITDERLATINHLKLVLDNKDSAFIDSISEASKQIKNLQSENEQLKKIKKDLEDYSCEVENKGNKAENQSKSLIFKAKDGRIMTFEDLDKEFTQLKNDFQTTSEHKDYWHREFMNTVNKEFGGSEKAVLVDLYSNTNEYEVSLQKDGESLATFVPESATKHLRQVNSDLKAKNDKLQERIKEQGEKLSKAKQENIHLVAKLTKIYKDGKDKYISDLEETNRNIKHSNKKLYEHRDALVKELGELQEEIKTLQLNIKDNQEEISGLKANLYGYQGQVERLKKQLVNFGIESVDEYRAQISRLKEDLKKSSSEINRLNIELKQAKGAIQDRDNAILVKNSRNKLQEDRLKSYGSAIELLNQIIDKRKTYAIELERTIQAQKTEIDKLKGQ